MNLNTTFTTAILLPAIISFVAQIALLCYAIGPSSSSTTKNESGVKGPMSIEAHLKNVNVQVKINQLEMCVIESTDALVN
jgi:hypothetical protein